MRLTCYTCGFRVTWITLFLCLDYVNYCLKTVMLFGVEQNRNFLLDFARLWFVVRPRCRPPVFLLGRPSTRLDENWRSAKRHVFEKRFSIVEIFEKAIVANSSERMKKRKIFDKPKQYLILPGIGLWFTANLPSYHFKSLSSYLELIFSSRFLTCITPRA